jgi:uncharacterized protein (DUF58 family)
MSRASFLGFLVFGLVLAGLVGLNGAVEALTIPLLLYWGYALWRAPDAIHLTVERELSSERAAPHSPVRVKLKVSNSGQSLEELTLEDVISPSLLVEDGSNHHLISLPKDGNFAFEYTVTGPRGAFPFERLHAEAADHLGLLRVVADIRTFGQLLIFPALARIRDVPIHPRRTRVYAGTIPARVGGAGVEFFGVRAFETGDPLGRINWRISARHMEDLYSNEFQQERVADVAVVLDGRERSNLYAGVHSLFEHSVLAAGAIADALLHQGNRVGLLVYSQFLQWTYPGYGRVQRERILYALSRAEPGASQVFEGLQYLPARLFPPQSQIILISPLLEDDYSTLVQLRARGYQVMIVAPDPVGFEAGRLRPRPSKFARADIDLSARIIRLERAWMLARLRRAGVHVIEWDVSYPFDQISRSAFRRVRRARSGP